MCYQATFMTGAQTTYLPRRALALQTTIVLSEVHSTAKTPPDLLYKLLNVLKKELLGGDQEHPRPWHARVPRQPNLKESSSEVCLSTSLNKFWLGITMSVSTVSERKRRPSSASRNRWLPSKRNGFRKKNERHGGAGGNEKGGGGGVIGKARWGSKGRVSEAFVDETVFASLM